MLNIINGGTGGIGSNKMEVFLEQGKNELGQNLLPSYLKMYEISGQDTITGHTFARYMKNKQQDNLIREHAKKQKKTKGIQQIAFTKLGLDDKDIQIQKTTLALLIYHAPTNEKASLIREALNNPNIIIQKTAAQMIGGISEEDQISLRSIVGEKIKQGLDNSDIQIQKTAAEMISCASKEEQTSLKNMVVEKIKQGLYTSNFEEQKVYAEMISCVPEDEIFLRNIVVEKIKQGLNNSDINIQKTAAEMISFASKEEQTSLKNIVVEKIKQGLDNSNIEEQKVYAEMISCVPEEDRISLIMLGLNNQSIETQRIFASMFYYVPKNKQKEIIDIISTKGLGKEIIESKLYTNKIIDENNLSRQKMEKTGSETTLIGGQLKDKIIIRHFEAKAFLTRQKLYENYELWQNAGFDYVPIEPILSYTLNKNGLVDVYSGVLDINLRDWQTKTDLFVNELQKEKNKIIKILKKIKTKHGHEHNGNFCLRFFRDEKGQPDFTRIPRLYLIDFDQAVSPEK